MLPILCQKIPAYPCINPKDPPIFFLKNFFTKKNSPSPLLAELADLKLQLDAACSQFDLLTDSDRIDACCYQIKSLKIRYDALLREARQQGLRREPYVSDGLHSPEKGV